MAGAGRACLGKADRGTPSGLRPATRTGFLPSARRFFLQEVLDHRLETIVLAEVDRAGDLAFRIDDQEPGEALDVVTTAGDAGPLGRPILGPIGVGTIQGDAEG